MSDSSNDVSLCIVVLNAGMRVRRRPMQRVTGQCSAYICWTATSHWKAVVAIMYNTVPRGSPRHGFSKLILPASSHRVPQTLVFVPFKGRPLASQRSRQNWRSSSQCSAGVMDAPRATSYSSNPYLPLRTIELPRGRSKAQRTRNVPAP
jgi:hypothetical protein